MLPQVRNKLKDSSSNENFEPEGSNRLSSFCGRKMTVRSIPNEPEGVAYLKMRVARAGKRFCHSCLACE